jgi:predicted DNA binding CopG/RHH family protein
MKILRKNKTEMPDIINTAVEMRKAFKGLIGRLLKAKERIWVRMQQEKLLKVKKKSLK